MVVCLISFVPECVEAMYSVTHSNSDIDVANIPIFSCFSSPIHYDDWNYHKELDINISGSLCRHRCCTPNIGNCSKALLVTSHVRYHGKDLPE